MERAAPVGFAQPFRSTTRGQIVDLLRCRPMTADELAAVLNLTNKGIRAQLLVLERDGLIRQRGRRRSGRVGKPAAIYEFDPAAEPLFSSAYAPILIAALDVIGADATGRDRLRLLRKIGRELAAAVPHTPARAIQDRARHALSVLVSWGGLARMERTNATLLIRSCGCPVSAAVRAHPATCIVVEAMLAKLIGSPVRQCCDRSSGPSCCFEIRAAGKSRAQRSGASTKRDHRALAARNARRDR